MRPRRLSPRGGAYEGASAGAPTDLETFSLSLAAVGAAVATVAVDSRAPLTVALLLIALAPWAAVAAGAAPPPWIFVAGTVVPAAAVILTALGAAPVFLGMFAVTRVASTTGRAGPIAATFAAAVALPVLFVVSSPDGRPRQVAYFTIGIAGSALLGVLLHHQRRLTAQLEASQRRLREVAAAEERHRIARDVHDTLAHSLTAVVVNVAGARRALAAQPGLAQEALERAEKVGREGLDTIRTVVGFLRPDDAADSGGASATDLPAIVAAQREAGVDIHLHLAADLAAIDAVTGSALVRIAQEAMTNAVRHAPGAPVTVEVRADDELHLAVTNGPPTAPPLDADRRRRGLGLISIRERARALGGTVAAGPTDEGGWRVSCALPSARTAARSTGEST